MARNGKSFKISEDLWDAFKHLRRPGELYANYPSDNAAMENLIFYMLYFRRPHTLILSQLNLEEQDLVHAYCKHCVLNDIDDREHLPKPATAASVLKRAKAWKSAGKQRCRLKATPKQKGRLTKLRKLLISRR